MPIGGAGPVWAGPVLEFSMGTKHPGAYGVVGLGFQNRQQILVTADPTGDGTAGAALGHLCSR